MAETAPAGMKAVLALRPFRTLWIAQFVSVFGDFLAMFGVVARITFQLHGSATDVSLVIVSYMVPVAFVAPAAGVLVDRWRLKRVMIASDLIRAVLAAMLVFSHSVPQICAILASIGFVSSFFAPAQAVAIRTLVPREQLLSANALLSQAFYVVRVIAPALAGTLVAWFGANLCFWADAGSFAISAALLSTLVIARAEAAGPPKKSSFFRDFIEGNRFVFTHRELSFAFASSCVAMFVLSSFSPLISVYVRDTLHAGPMLYGAVSAMVGVGLIGGTQVIRGAASKRKMEEVVIGGLLGLGAGAALLGLARIAALAPLSTFLIGAGIAFVVVPAQTLSQKETPPEMQGRVSSTFMALFSLAQVLGMLLSGILADRLGIRQLFLACASVTVVIALSGWFVLQPRRQVESGADSSVRQ